MIEPKNIYDRRVIKTKNAIHGAMTNLLTKKDFRSITVTDIANIANINRKTFYNYYTSVDDVINEIIDSELQHIFEDKLENISYEKIFDDPNEIFSKLVTVFHENQDFYSALFKIDEPVNLLQKTESILKEKITKTFLEKYPKNAENIILLCEYCTPGIFSAYRYWYNSGQQIPLEVLSKKVCDMTQSCMKTLYPDGFPEK